MDWFLTNQNYISRSKKYTSLDIDGITPDPKKIDSILKMEFPKDKETMHSFLGLINFLNWYSPQLAELCAPLLGLILKDAHYNITEEHISAFAALKNEFRKTIVLPYFDKYKDTMLQMDASKRGFGAVILQDNNPVYYASRTLTSAEKNYQNLKWECMAAVWGMEKFHYFLYGKHFTLQTDQKPLVSIFRKHMIDVSPRIQQIAICAWQYQFEPQYISGKMNVIPDALLRVTPLDFEDHDVDKEVLAIKVLTYTAIEEREKTELLNETDKDAELHVLKMVISKGWPKKRSSLAPNLQPYWNYRDELTIEDGILMKGQKIIIPTSLKQQYISKIHAGHTGIGSCLKKAREVFFWVNYYKDIQKAVEKCSLCQEQQNVLMTNQCYISEVPHIHGIH